MSEYLCRSCSHIFEVKGSETCPYCGSENTGMYGPRNATGIIPRSNSRALQPEKDVYDLTHMGISFRLAHGYNLIKKAGDS